MLPVLVVTPVMTMSFHLEIDQAYYYIHLHLPIIRTVEFYCSKAKILDRTICTN